MKKVLIAVYCAVCCSGCALFDSGIILIATDSGIRTWYDGQNGFITNAKTQMPNGDSAHWVSRYNEEEEITDRKGIAYGVIAPGEPEAEANQRQSNACPLVINNNK